MLQLIWKSIFAGYIVSAFQHGRYRVGVFFPVFPKIWGSCLFGSAGICYIEHIPQSRFFSAAVDKGYALGAASDITAHLFIPEVILSAGCGIRALGVDHDLFGIRVLIQPCSGRKKTCPSLIAARDLPLCFVCHLHIHLQFAWHRVPPSW